MQDGVVGNAQIVGLAHGDAMHMPVDDDIFGDGDVLVEHLDPGLATVHLFVAHEDRMAEGALADVQHVLGDGDIGGGGVLAGGPELDHVGMIAGAAGGAEIMDVVFGDQPVFDRREVHPVRAHVAHFVAGDFQIGDIRQVQTAVEGLEQVVLDGHIAAFAHRQADAIAIAVFGLCQAKGLVALEGAVADRDMVAFIHLERTDIHLFPRGIGVIKDNTVQRDVGRVAHVHPAEDGRVVGIVRDQGDHAVELQIEIGNAFQTDLTPVAPGQSNGLTALGGGQLGNQLIIVGSIKYLRHTGQPLRLGPDPERWGRCRSNLKFDGVALGVGLRQYWAQSLKPAGFC